MWPSEQETGSAPERPKEMKMMKKEIRGKEVAQLENTRNRSCYVCGTRLLRVAGAQVQSPECSFFLKFIFIDLQLKAMDF